MEQRSMYRPWVLAAGLTVAAGIGYYVWTLSHEDASSGGKRKRRGKAAGQKAKGRGTSKSQKKKPGAKTVGKKRVAGAASASKQPGVPKQTTKSRKKSSRDEEVDEEDNDDDDDVDVHGDRTTDAERKPSDKSAASASSASAKRNHVRKSGVMLKYCKGSANKWQERWFDLEDGMLTYNKGKVDSVDPKGGLFVQTVDAGQTRKPKKEWSIHISGRVHPGLAKEKDSKTKDAEKLGKTKEMDKLIVAGITEEEYSAWFTQLKHSTAFQAVATPRAPPSFESLRAAVDNAISNPDLDEVNRILEKVKSSGHAERLGGSLRSLEIWAQRLDPSSALDSDSRMKRLRTAVNAVSVASFARGLVSKKKFRFQEDGFDLDLSYITPNIIAMGFPCEGASAAIRNPMKDVLRFLDDRHTTGEERHFRIYNLCPTEERTYDFGLFHNQVAHFPFEDHNPPTIETSIAFCDDAHSWLQANPKNIIAVHCKAGKGRTGTMIATYLQHCGQYADPGEALKFYGEQRVSNGKGVTIPSQERYVRYYSQVVQGLLPKVAPRYTLRKFTMHTVPKHMGPFDSFFVISVPSVENSDILHTGKEDIIFTTPQGQDTVDFDCGVEIQGDIEITMYDKKTSLPGLPKSKSRMFGIAFHTAFVTSPTQTFTRLEIDKANKDKKGNFDEDFRLTVHFG